MLYDFGVYVGCGLTCAPPEFRAKIEKLKFGLGRICKVLSFLNFDEHHSPRRVYEWDIGCCVGGCDLLLAICDEPSTGLGYEIATQVEKHRKPVLAVAHHRSLVTSLILDPGQPGYEFRRYEDLTVDVPRFLAETLARMRAEQVHEMAA